MALDINRLLDQVEDARDATLNLIDKFKRISDFSKDFGGVIASTVPAHIQKNIEIITELTEGKSQNSLSSLIELIENIPIGQVRTRRAVRTSIDPAAASQMMGSSNVDLTPNTGLGIQSAITAQNTEPMPVKESALSAYLKAGRIKEKQNYYATASLVRSLGTENGRSINGERLNEEYLAENHQYDLSKILEGSEAANELGNALEISMNSGASKVKKAVQRMHEDEQKEEQPKSWRQAVENTVHLNENNNAFEGMFGGMKNAQKGIGGMSFDEIFANGVVGMNEAIHDLNI